MTSLPFDLDIGYSVVEPFGAADSDPREKGDSYWYFAVHQAREKQVAGLGEFER